MILEKKNQEKSLKNKVFVIVGPTAVGKTALGIELCQKFNGEVISGDSQQVYRGLDIGTAKASQSEQNAAVHHLIDVRDVEESYSAFDFVHEANQEIEQILSEGKIPVIVGGTGLYIQALIEGYHLGGESAHKEMMVLRKELSVLTDAELFEKLTQKNIVLNEPNRRRAIRALELDQYGQGENVGSPYDFFLIGLNTSRDVLYERIDARVDVMRTKGLVEEARQLFDEFPNVQAARAIGYKEFFPYFRNEITDKEALENVKRNSRRYAKRQLTWFKNRMSVPFFDVRDENYPQNVLEAAQKFLEESPVS
ncbi:tRNA (adenosine(37)-N6)-dimethylallyltransferase MiaA [Lactococcus hircilactis]|uniref:tRNA dimethylallyltransferase n=1 Tax=Lactococcus hircilactis TaxID=1494462 RepID=A0A7X1Z957_9LACT|nr:tRNA (adenosine(37)-N6)-dimethylallyltransferase MiaA [Lactococcus hircilactis]MQW39032.1 tRNA (adenosine(37)-N6)-dimethylallyltransferase MiaA [Lactococcus hircilactis]